MTELLHMHDCYLREFDARIETMGQNFAVLDQTTFYPLGGGQPSDQGMVNGVRVIEVRKEAGEVRHFLEKTDGFHEGAHVHGVIDWDRRYAFMRMHTAQHVLSAIVLDMAGASTAGNQIGANQSRMDFCPLKMEDGFIENVSKAFNHFVDRKIPVKIYFSTREEVMNTIDEKRRTLFARLPEAVKDIRIVEVVGVDKVPCGGTHVKNTGEIGHIRITKTEGKGLDTVRMYFELEN
jgi:misacylated tRNA(Ala) deacylase